jgi:hypothetical protein
MDRKLWGVAVIVAGLFAAAWIYIDLQKRHWEKTGDRIRTQVDEVDSLTQPIRPDTPIEQARQRSQSVAQRMRTLSGEQTRRTDSVQRIIKEENLLGDEPPSKK